MELLASNLFIARLGPEEPVSFTWARPDSNAFPDQLSIAFIPACAPFRHKYMNEQPPATTNADNTLLATV